MGRPPGIIETKKRKPSKPRKDIGKKRKYYAGKKVKGKRAKYFEKKIGNKEYLKLFIWEIKPMTKDGYKRWNRKIRRYAIPMVYIPKQVHTVHVSLINTQAKMEDFVASNYWEGVFLVKGFSNANNKFRCKNVKICEIKVKQTEKGNVGHLTKNYRLRRYKWFYQD